MHFSFMEFSNVFVWTLLKKIMILDEVALLIDFSTSKRTWMSNNSWKTTVALIKPKKNIFQIWLVIENSIITYDWFFKDMIRITSWLHLWIPIKLQVEICRTKVLTTRNYKSFINYLSSPVREPIALTLTLQSEPVLLEEMESTIQVVMSKTEEYLAPAHKEPQ